MSALEGYFQTVLIPAEGFGSQNQHNGGDGWGEDGGGGSSGFGGGRGGRGGGFGGEGQKGGFGEIPLPFVLLCSLVVVSTWILHSNG